MRQITDRIFSFPDSVFTINDVAYNFSDIKCLKPPQSIVTEVGHCSTENVVKGRIGFNLNYEFLEVIEVCYDNLRHMTVHTTHKLNRNVASAETEFDRKNYILFELFETPDQFYKCKNQIMSLGHLFNSQTQAQKYIDCDKGGDMYLTKAHLVPKNDFLFGFQQKATSYDITTAPQWQTINSGNWRILENRIRRYANSNNVDLTITTGALNVLELPNLFDVPQFLQLTKGENNTFVSIPTLFWKLVHDRTNNSGIVFVLINNPYKNFRRTRAYVVCTCVCARTKSWFDGLDRFDRKKGYIYCCTLEDFRARTEMKYYPFTVKNLLE
jgi:hypothetical protein